MIRNTAFLLMAAAVAAVPTTGTATTAPADELTSLEISRILRRMPEGFSETDAAMIYNNLNLNDAMYAYQVYKLVSYLPETAFLSWEHLQQAVNEFTGSNQSASEYWTELLNDYDSTDLTSRDAEFIRQHASLIPISVSYKEVLDFIRDQRQMLPADAAETQIQALYSTVIDTFFPHAASTGGSPTGGSTPTDQGYGWDSDLLSNGISYEAVLTNLMDRMGSDVPDFVQQAYSQLYPESAATYGTTTTEGTAATEDYADSEERLIICWDPVQEYLNTISQDTLLDNVEAISTYLPGNFNLGISLKPTRYADGSIHWNFQADLTHVIATYSENTNDVCFKEEKLPDGSTLVHYSDCSDQGEICLVEVPLPDGSTLVHYTDCSDTCLIEVEMPDGSTLIHYAC